MTNCKIGRGVVMCLLILVYSFSFSQDMASCTYRISLRLTDINLENSKDSLRKIEFYSGNDEEMSCNVANLNYKRALLKFNLDSLDFEIFSMKSGKNLFFLPQKNG